MQDPSPKLPKHARPPIVSEVPPEDAQRTRRGRHGRTAIVEIFKSRCDLIRAGDDDVYVIARSRDVLRGHVDGVVDEVYRRLLAFPQTAIHFSARTATGAAEAEGRSRIDNRKESFREWLLCVIDRPMDAETAVYVASVGHAHVRPRKPIGTPIKAGYLLITMSWVQGLLISILSDWCSDSVELGRHTAAWCRRLMMHLDLLLTVFGFAESTAHWY